VEEVEVEVVAQSCQQMQQLWLKQLQWLLLLLVCFLVYAAAVVASVEELPLHPCTTYELMLGHFVCCNRRMGHDRLVCNTIIESLPRSLSQQRKCGFWG
jgi:hypothetical protein